MQELVLSQMLNSGGAMHAVFLAGLFLIVAFRRESIAIPGMFKLAYVLFAMSIFLPAVLAPVMNLFGDGSSRFLRVSMNAEANWVVNVVYGAAGPALFALSLLCAFGSMFPRRLPLPSATAPTKHPLD